MVPDAPICPENPGSHDACAVAGILRTATRPPQGCDPDELHAASRTCDKFAPPCLMVPLPSTAKVCAMWKDWDKCDALTTSEACPTVSCVANVSCPAGPAAWCSAGEWGNIHARGWCTGFCEEFGNSMVNVAV